MPERAVIIAAGRAAWARIKKSHSFDDWLKIGRALLAGRASEVSQNLANGAAKAPARCRRVETPVPLAAANGTGVHARRGGGGLPRALDKPSRVMPRSELGEDRVNVAPAPRCLGGEEDAGARSGSV